MVSVIIPAYNAEKYIEECIQSVLEQSYVEWELIIINDGSSDQTENIVKKYCQIERKIRLISISNSGAGNARNIGTQQAKGEYCLYLDADDKLYPDSLQIFYDAMSVKGIDLVMGNISIISEDSAENGGYIITNDCKTIDKNILSICAKMVPNPSNKLYRTDIIRKHNIVFPNSRIGEDFSFYLKYLLHCKTISLISDNVYMYRISHNSLSRTFNSRILDIIQSIEDIKHYYYKKKSGYLYNKFILRLELIHIGLQLCNLPYISDKKERVFCFKELKAYVKDKCYYRLSLEDKDIYKEVKFRIKLQKLYETEFIYNKKDMLDCFVNIYVKYL